MQPNNLTALDFEDIKSSIKTYLRTRNEFSDYDFEGSGLSYLIDTLAYNTYYSAFNANMSMNEAFLPSATLRDNIVNIAKELSERFPNSKIEVHVDVGKTNRSKTRIYVDMIKGWVTGMGYLFKIKPQSWASYIADWHSK